MKFRGFAGLGFGLGLGGFGNGSVFGSQIWVWRIQGSGSGLVFGVRIRVWEFEGVRGSNGSRHCGWFWISTRYLVWFVGLSGLECGFGVFGFGTGTLM